MRSCSCQLKLATVLGFSQYRPFFISTQKQCISGFGSDGLKYETILFVYSHFTKYRAASFLEFHLLVFLVHPIPQQADAKLIRAQSLYQ
ncbi:hypothetical protein XM73_c11860 [Vibrio vulnificus]|nr:hypothetical protein XM77_c11878 [Vibrio vulnificus]OUD79011.1 hypothetical protein XM73_c11860 [Vibrio vulnificus]